MQVRILVLLALLPILYGTASAKHRDRTVNVHVQFNTSFGCSKYQPTSGSLKFQFDKLATSGDWALFKEWNMTRAFEKRITLDEKFNVNEELFDNAVIRRDLFRLVLVTPCGALSPIGKMCSHEITVEAIFVKDSHDNLSPYLPNFKASTVRAAGHDPWRDRPVGPRLPARQEDLRLILPSVCLLPFNVTQNKFFVG